MEEFKQLIPEFGLLTLSVLLFFGVILHYGLHRKSMAIFYLLILTELYTPACYYMAGITSYLKFGLKAFQLYMLMGTLSFLGYSLILICVQRLRFERKYLVLTHCDISAKRMAMLWLFVMCVIGMVVIYLVHFRDNFPFYQAVFRNFKMEDRPDTSGAIPHWFTLSAFIVVALPTFYLYYHQKRNFHKITNLALICLLSLAMVLGGNKGFVVYWFIFLWVYLWKMRIDGRVVAAALIAIIFTSIIMGGSLTNISISYLKSTAEYGFGRFFLTQGAMLVNRFEMVLQDYSFNDTRLSEQVFPFVYGEEGGSAPTYYLGDLLIQFGFVGGFLLHLLVFMVLAIIGQYLDRQEFSEYKTYLFFCVQYFLGMAEISMPFLYRLLLILALALLFALLGARSDPLRSPVTYSSGSSSSTQLLRNKSPKKEF